VKVAAIFLFEMVTDFEIKTNCEIERYCCFFKNQYKNLLAIFYVSKLTVGIKFRCRVLFMKTVHLCVYLYIPESVYIYLSKYFFLFFSHSDMFS